MENTQLKILSEIKASLESLKSQIELIEAKVDAVAVLLPDPEDDLPENGPDPLVEPEIPAEPEPAAEPEPEPEAPVEPIDLDISEMVVPEVPVAEVPETPVAEAAAGEDIPTDEPEPMDVIEPEPVEVVELEPVAEDIPEPVVEESVAEVPVVEAPVVEKKKVLDVNEAEGLKEKRAVLDRMTEKQSWRVDMPGSPVSNIISAISLNDRVLFINSLFGEDPVKFRSTIDRLNSMSDLGEAVEYLVGEFPQWNLDSDVVYRFMMAVRRKLS